MNELGDFVKNYALKKAPAGGHFVLSSGVESSFYIDMRKVTLNSSGLCFIIDELLSVLEDFEFDAIGGPGYGAAPIIGALLQEISYKVDEEIRGFVIRKERKEHGAQKLVEGRLIKGDRVIIVEDVITSGGSVLEAISAVEEEGCEVIGVIAVLDRLQGASKALEKYLFKSLLTIEDLDL